METLISGYPFLERAVRLHALGESAVGALDHAPKQVLVKVVPVARHVAVAYASSLLVGVQFGIGARLGDFVLGAVPHDGGQPLEGAARQQELVPTAAGAGGVGPLHQVPALERRIGYVFLYGVKHGVVRPPQHLRDLARGRDGLSVYGIDKTLRILLISNGGVTVCGAACGCGAC